MIEELACHVAGLDDGSPVQCHAVVLADNAGVCASAQEVGDVRFVENNSPDQEGGAK